MAQLTFLGAARTVTGSKYLLDTGSHRVLFDCGLFQGLKELRERNWRDLPVPADSIHAIVLTHAHLDHCGYIPRLVGQRFRGRIFCTPGTADLCRLVLPDAGRLQEEDAKYANRKGFSKHAPALPLFTEADAARALTQLQPVGFDRAVNVAPGVQVAFTPVGHLLGAAAARVELDGGRRIVFGGDLGRYDRPVLRDPSPIAHADVLLIESTYGDRAHGPDDGGARLGDVVRETIGRGGKVIVPSFAIGRVEEVLYWLKRLEEDGAIPTVPVFVDSPMALDALQFYSARSSELDDEFHGTRNGIGNFATRRFQGITSPQHSKELTASSVPSIVISASGMATGGRVLHHLAQALPDPRNTVLFVGYQAPGTRGRSLVDGAASVKIHGRSIPVAAQIAKIDAMSAHADAGEIVKWLRQLEAPPDITYVVHGEPPAMDALRQIVARDLGWRTEAPAYLEQVDL
jgi:metallo-beta-lactamase family protein